MAIARVLAVFTLGQADILRRAMGKKDRAEMAAQRKAFIAGAMKNGVPEWQAENIFELVDKFAGYGFVKSHAAAYALIAYQTAYFKANHPVEFFAASMSQELGGNTDKLGVFRKALVDTGIALLQPDINLSGAAFQVERDGDGKAAAMALGGLLAGVTVSGVLLALFQANAGGAWDNAKKMFEEGKGVEVDGVYHTKGSDAHKAGVVGDTVGDPLKDTSGPSLNILLKLMTVIALVIAPLLIQ